MINLIHHQRDHRPMKNYDAIPQTFRITREEMKTLDDLVKQHKSDKSKVIRALLRFPELYPTTVNKALGSLL
jgi:hypothetical protein